MSTTAAVEVRRHRFTVTQFAQMAAAGVFGADDHVELLDGEIIQMSPIGPPHADVVDRLTRLFVRAVGDDAVVRVQHPLLLSDRSQPQPDLALVRARSYAGGHPEPADTLLVIEVTDTSLTFDQTVKRPLYAAAGIAEVWIIDVTARRLQVSCAPSGRSYTDVQTVGVGETVTVPGFASVTLDPGQLFD